MFDIALAIYNSKVIYDHPKCPSERTLVKINASYPFHWTYSHETSRCVDPEPEAPWQLVTTNAKKLQMNFTPYMQF